VEWTLIVGRSIGCRAARGADRRQFPLIHNIRKVFPHKVVPVLFLTEHHAMKACWGVEVQLHLFFDLSTRWR
jgi:hypothetical protein